MFFRAASPPASRKGSLSCIKGSSGGADGNGNWIIPFVRPVWLRRATQDLYRLRLRKGSVVRVVVTYIYPRRFTTF